MKRKASKPIRVWIIIDKDGRPCKMFDPSWKKQSLDFDTEFQNIIQGTGNYSVKPMYLVERSK